MIETDKENGFVELTVSDKANILHRVGSAEYPEIRRTTVRAEEASAWEEVEQPAFTKAEYDAKVAELIRERYTADEEFALHRKMLNAAFSPSVASVESNAVMTEYAEYNAFVEQCKAAAKDKEMYHKQEGDQYGED